MEHEVVAALIVESGRILLGQRAGTRKYYPNVWDVFGGHVEAGEDIEQTLVRELEEELGITPTAWSFVETLTRPAQDLRVHLFLVRAWRGTPVNRQPEEHSSIGWFSLAEAVQLQLADEVYPSIFQRYLSG